MDRIALEALKSLTSRVNLSTGLGHPSDEDAAKTMFKILAENNISLTASEVTGWATQNSWRSEDAVKLGELGNKIMSGGRVQIHNKNSWAENIFELWKERSVSE